MVSASFPVVARRLTLFLGLFLAGAGALSPASGAPAPPPAAEETRIWMRNLVLFPYGDVPASVSKLSGIVRPTHEKRPITLDDVSSYAVSVEHASMALSASDVAILMNRHILPAGNSPIKHVDITFNDGSLSMSGTMVKLGVPVPFTATATLAPTTGGDMRVHMTAMRAGNIVPKGVMDALGMQLSNIAQPATPRAFRVEGDDLLVPLASMFPPPVFLGKLTALRVTPAGLFASVGREDNESEPPGGVQAKSFLAMRGGTVLFAQKLTMRNADMAMVPLDPQKDLGFSPAHYYQQMVAGETLSRPDYGLVARIKDFRDLNNKRQPG